MGIIRFFDFAIFFFILFHGFKFPMHQGESLVGQSGSLIRERFASVEIFQRIIEVIKHVFAQAPFGLYFGCFFWITVFFRQRYGLVKVFNSFVELVHFSVGWSSLLLDTLSATFVPIPQFQDSREVLDTAILVFPLEIHHCAMEQRRNELRFLLQGLSLLLFGQYQQLFLLVLFFFDESVLVMLEQAFGVLQFGVIWFQIDGFLKGTFSRSVSLEGH